MPREALGSHKQVHPHFCHKESQWSPTPLSMDTWNLLGLRVARSLASRTALDTGASLVLAPRLLSWRKPVQSVPSEHLQWAIRARWACWDRRLSGAPALPSPAQTAAPSSAFTSIFK